MQMYETIFILDSLLAPDEIDKIINRVKEMIETNGGKVLTVEKCGKRRLAYEIQKKQYGFYVAIEFEGEGPIPNSLEREYNFNDKILRYLTYRYTKNKIIARKNEAELKKDQPTVAEIPKILPGIKEDKKKEPEEKKKIETKEAEVVETEDPGSLEETEDSGSLEEEVDNA